MVGHAACLAGLLALALSGCRFTPLSGKLSPGEEPFVILAGEGAGGVVDLFAIPAAGGRAIQLTFTRQEESSPALDPTGVMVAFLRRDLGTGTGQRFVVMNLINGAERAERVPEALGVADRIAWSDDGRRLYLRAARGLLFSLAPPEPLDLAPVAAGDLAGADSALAVLIGTPAFGRVRECDGRAGLCVEVPGREPQLLIAGGREPFRWGSDSVAYLVGDRVEVVPLGGGRARRVSWTGPNEVRAPTYSGGAAPRS